MTFKLYRTVRWLILAAFLVAMLRSSHAFTATDANRIFSAYNKAFYFTQGTNGYFRSTMEGKKMFFGDRAEQLEMILDVYRREDRPKAG